MTTKKPRISFVFPLFNEAGNIQALYERVTKICEQSAIDHELIFVDDGSTDASLENIKKLRAHDTKVRYLSLSRNFGHQAALFAGMSRATGDAVITMDADLQHPPSLIPQMIQLWRGGAEVVYTTKDDRSVPRMRLVFMRIFYWLISRISNIDLSFGQSDFRLLDKKALAALLSIPEYHKFLRGQVSWIGFRQKGIKYYVDKRLSGKAKYSYRELTGLALAGIFSFSRYPLHLIMLLGMSAALVSSLYLLFILVVWVLHMLNITSALPLPAGWVAIMTTVIFLGSVQLIAIGTLGEYIGRIYDQTKGRPVFIARETSDEKDLS